MHGHVVPTYPCHICGFSYPSVQQLHDHILTHEPYNDYTVENGLNGVVSVYTRNYLPPTASLELTLGQDHGALLDILLYESVLKRFAKCSFCTTCEFVKRNLDGTVERSATIYLRSKTFILTPLLDMEHFIKRSHSEILVSCQDFIQHGSDWTLFAVHR